MAPVLRPDAAIYFISGNAPIVPFARLARIPTVFQIDGLDSEREKWPGAAKADLRIAERISSRVANICVTDSTTVADRYFERFGRRIEAIPYGAHLDDPGGREWCDRLGVEPGRFILFVGRLVPENNAHLLVDAHRETATDWPLVVVGDAPYSERYIADLRARAGADVHFPGYVFGDGYAELVHRAGIVCLPTEVGGTHPVIIESMAAGACVVVGDHAPNVEVVGDAAAVFPFAGGVSALAATLTALIGDPPRRRELGERAAARAQERYAWRPVAERYLALCASLVSRSAP